MTITERQQPQQVAVGPSITSTRRRSPQMVHKKGSNGLPQRSNSSGDLVATKRMAKPSSPSMSSPSSSRRRSSDNASVTTIGSSLRKGSTRNNNNNNNNNGGNKKRVVEGKKKEKTAAGFAAWSAARLASDNMNMLHSHVPSSPSTPVTAVYMPTVVAPVWQPVVGMLSLVNQAAVSPRLPPSVVLSSSSSSSSFMESSVPPTPPCSPCSHVNEVGAIVGEEEVSAVVTEATTTVAPIEAALPFHVVHDDFEIETSRVSCVIPTSVDVVPQPIEAVNTMVPDVSSSSIISGAVHTSATFVSRTPAMRTLIMVMVAMTALFCVMLTTSGRNVMGAAAVPSVMLLAAFINRSSSSSPSLFDDEEDTLPPTRTDLPSSSNNTTTTTTGLLPKSSTVNNGHIANRRAARRGRAH
jgi:hypothetical protein